MEEKEKHKLNILWLSVAPMVRSGYGQVTKNIVFRLAELGWPIVIVGYYGLHEGGMLQLGGVPVLPIYNREKDYGKKSVPYYIEQFAIDLPILFSDFWRFEWFSRLENSMFYGPIDHCYDKKTEILTENGWKRFQEVSLKEKVLTFNMSTENLEWQKPLKKFEFVYKGKMYHFASQFLDLKVTPNHRLLIARRNSLDKFVYREGLAKEYWNKDRIRFRQTGKWKGSNPKTFKMLGRKLPIKEFLQFMGFYLSEGQIDHTPINSNYTISLAQKDPQVLQFFARVLEKITNNKVQILDGKVIVRDKVLWKYLFKFGYSFEKYIPKFIKNLSPNLLRIFLEAYEIGDGGHYSDERRVIYTSSNKMRDDLQEIILKLGAGTIYHLHHKVGNQTIIRNRKVISKHPLWRISILTSRGKEPLLNKHKLNCKQETYSGKIYCLEVPNHFLIVRRNGKPVISGNSAYGLQHVKTLKQYDEFITISKWAQKEAKKYGRICQMFPHGVNTKLFKPMDKLLCREHFNFREDKFIIGIVAANNDPEPRKGWDKMFLGLKLLFEKFPNLEKEIVIFAYTRPQTSAGFDLPGLAQSIGIEKNVFFPDRMAHLVGLPESEMAMLYNSFDILMNCSRREGFGLPIAEAQACRIPVIATNFSSMPELVKGHGWLVKSKDWMYTPLLGKCAVPNQEEIAKKLEEAYFNEELRRKYGNLSRKFILKYDWDLLIKKYWIPYLEKREEELTEKGEEPKTLEVSLPHTWMKEQSF